jgi:hypothetical protein
MLRGRARYGSVLFSVSALLGACSANPDPVGDSVNTNAGTSNGSGGKGSDAGTPSIGATAGGPDLIPVGGNDGVVGVAEKLEFDPATITLVIDSAAAEKVAEYTLKATMVGGAKVNVSAESLEFDRPDLAASKNGTPVVLTATGAVAGKGILHAVFGGLEATAELDVQLVEKQVEGTIPDDVVTALDGGGATPGADPTLTSLLYPYDKTVFALGLQSPQFMWAPPAATDVYRLHVEQAGYKYDYYSAAAMGKLAIPQEAWDRITSSNTGDPMVVSLFRYDQAAKKAYSSASVSFTIAPESLRGAIYYWTASRTTGQGNITRIHPGVGSMPETMVQGKCVGCHAVSADGSTMVLDIDDEAATTAPTVSPYRRGFGDTRPWVSYALPAATQTLQTTMYGAGPALTPDGKYVVFGNGAQADGTGVVPPGSKNFSLAVTATGMVVPTSGLDDIVFGSANVNLMMPSFSLDGTKLAAVEGGGNLVENVIPDSKRIVYMNFDAAGPKFDPVLHEIVNISQFAAGNQGLGYPAFTPDNEYVAYHTGKYSTGCHPKEVDEIVAPCLDGSRDSGEIWMSKVTGGTPIRLTALNDPPATKDHNAGREPMFCPVKRGGYSWMVFTSMRDWGNEMTDPGPNINGKRRLWVAAIDGEIGAGDPSHPAFYLEGQENTPNMRGFWALDQCIQTPPPGVTAMECKANFECCSGFCVDKVCVEKTSQGCAGIGDACEAAGDCCNQGVVSCVDKKCKVRPPPK